MEINGFSEAHRTGYLEALIPMAESYGWKIYRMSDLVDSSPKDFHTSVCASLQDHAIPVELKEKLFFSASKRPIRDDYERSALEYWTANVLERPIIEQYFPDQVFLTFNDLGDDVLFSEKLSILHWYPIKKGSTDKPWFRED